MRFGYCANMKAADTVAKAGFDYIECPASAIYAMSDDEFTHDRQILRDSGLKCETTNLLLSKEIMVYETSDDVVKEYFKKLFHRLGELGVRVAVFGSGGARRVPKTMTMADAEARFIDFTRLAGELALPYGFTIALEPLNFRETNFMLTMDDGYDLAKRVDMDNVGLLMDLFHFAFELKSMESVENWKDKLCHIHIAEPFTRVLPRRDAYDYTPLFSSLKSIGYTGSASVEAHLSSEEALAEACRLLRASI